MMKKVTVFYDGSCPSCRRDRRWYERFARPGSVDWFDITGQDEVLRAKGIAPQAALMSLHVEDEAGRVINDIDAYRLLFDRIFIFKPIAWLMTVPVIKQWLSRRYRIWVVQRLEKEGRLPMTSCSGPTCSTDKGKRTSE